MMPFPVISQVDSFPIMIAKGREVFNQLTGDAGNREACASAQASSRQYQGNY
jgi:hypothetical protein